MIDADYGVIELIKTPAGPLIRLGRIGLAPFGFAYLRYRIPLFIHLLMRAELGRLLLGCCVIKVQPPANFRQWYYDRLEPWRHYVPVKADMSDQLDQIAWCRAHPAECEAIAQRGAQLAHALTLEGEIGKTVARLNAQFGGKPDARV
jgi:hypothetical protein